MESAQLMKLTPEQIQKAGQIIKVLSLASTPGMDLICIKLNCGLTYREEREARLWAKAFELAAEKGDPITLAAQLNKEFR